jgi:hypothetical protein
MRRMRVVLVAAVALGVQVALGACGGTSMSSQPADSGPDRMSACVPGQSIACVSQSGCNGAQVCKDDGTGYGPCACFDAHFDEGGETDGTAQDAPGDTADADNSLPDVTGDTVLATGQFSIGIAVDSTTVYWGASDGHIRKCAKTGCNNQPTDVASNQSSTTGMATDGTNVYWTTFINGTGTVAQCPVSGCVSPTVLASGLAGPAELTVNGTTVFWVNYFAGTVTSCAIGGCANTPTVLASGQGNPQSIAIDSTNAYWTDHGASAMKCALGSCQPVGLGPVGPGDGRLGIDATNAYWTDVNGGNVFECALGGCGGNPTQLASGQGGPFKIVSDGKNVYWTNFNDGTIARCAVGGCGGKPTVLATGQVGADGIAVDALNVYWVNYNDGRVMTTAK